MMATAAQAMQAPRRLKVEVLPTDIRLGVQNNCEKCAVARAVKRMFKGKHFEQVEVHGAGVKVYLKNGRRLIYNGTSKMNKFIDAFDEDKKKVKPTTISLPLIDDYIW